MALSTDLALVSLFSAMLGREVSLEEARHIDRTVFALWVEDRLDTPHKTEKYLEELRSKT